MLAVELRQFAGEGLKTIVPTLYGQTERKPLGRPINKTIAALRAHRTRWEQRLKTAAEAEKAQIEATIAEYDARIGRRRHEPLSGMRRSVQINVGNLNSRRETP